MNDDFESIDMGYPKISEVIKTLRLHARLL
jgi:hypothetical protein